jgi:Peptidase family M41
MPETAIAIPVHLQVPTEWSRYGRRVWDWAEQLHSLVHDANSKLPVRQGEWLLCGNGVVLQAEDVTVGKEVAHRVSGHAGMELHIYPGSHGLDDFPSWLDEVCSGSAAMVYLTPGHWLGGSGGDDFLEGQANRNSDDQDCQVFRDSLSHAFATKIRGHSVVLVTCVRSEEMLNLDLRKVGFFDRRIQVPALTMDGLVSDFVNLVGAENLGDTFNCHKRLGGLLHHEYPDTRRRALACNALRRQAWAQNRKVEFSDLLHLVAYGTAEVDAVTVTHEERWRSAVHEAGHAVMAHLGSRHMTPPSMSSILTIKDSLGIVLPNFSARESQSNDPTWRDAIHGIQVSLAGRAAEHILLGCEEISAEGSSSDLQRAKIMITEAVGRWGLPSKCDSITDAVENIFVVSQEPSPIELERIEKKAEALLKMQFHQTLKVLGKHRDYLLAVAQELKEKWVLFEEDFEAIYAEVLQSPVHQFQIDLECSSV